MFDELQNITFQVKCGVDSSGSTFLISEDYAITAYHVVEDYQSEKIELHSNGEFKAKAILQEVINIDFKTLDVALLKLDRKLDCGKFLPIVQPSKLPIGVKWNSWGFPRSKEINGEPMFHSDCTINQHLQSLSGKFDILLNHSRKLPSYEGFSGAPLIVNNYIVGVINMELSVNGNSKELNALSVKYWKELLNETGIVVEEKEIQTPTHNKKTKLETFFDNLNKTFNQDNEVSKIIDDLKRFIDERDRIPLEQKLKDGGKEYLYEPAAWLWIQYEKKLTLTQFNMPAQEIHAHILGIVLNKFHNLIYPLIHKNATDDEILEITNEKIIEPIIKIINEHDYNNLLRISTTEIQGMIFYLASKCHIKWKL